MFKKYTQDIIAKWKGFLDFVQTLKQVVDLVDLAQCCFYIIVAAIVYILGNALLYSSKFLSVKQYFFCEGSKYFVLAVPFKAPNYFYIT